MNKKNKLKAFFIVLLILTLTITMIPFMSSCAKETIFGSLTMCETVNEDTYEPIYIKNEVNLFTKVRWASINIQNVKGTDSYRFLWKNEKTGEILADVSGQYKKDEPRFLEGWFASSVFPKEGADVISLPGSYLVEFYHNGELNTTAKFTIKEPVSKILSVSLASEVSETQEPVQTTQEFNSGSPIYACVQINYVIPGDMLTAKWYDGSGAVILETPMELKDAFYRTSWIAFTLESVNDKPIPEGQYKVELYLNEVKYNEFMFGVTVAPGQAGTDITFDKGNIFTEAESKYYFSINYPDGCQYTWQEGTDGMSVTFTPLNENDAYTTMMIVTIIDSAPTNEDYDAFADEISKQTAAGVGGMKQKGDRTAADGKLPNGTPYKEYTYYFNDENGLEYGLILDLIPINGMFYVWYGFANNMFYDQLNSSYYGSLATLEFKQ